MCPGVKAKLKDRKFRFSKSGCYVSQEAKGFGNDIMPPIANVENMDAMWFDPSTPLLLLGRE